MKTGEIRMVMVRVLAVDPNPEMGDLAYCQPIARNKQPIEGVGIWIDPEAMLTPEEFEERVLAQLGRAR